MVQGGAGSKRLIFMSSCKVLGAPYFFERRSRTRSPKFSRAPLFLALPKKSSNFPYRMNCSTEPPKNPIFSISFYCGIEPPKILHFIKYYRDNEKIFYLKIFSYYFGKVKYFLFLIISSIFCHI